MHPPPSAHRLTERKRPRAFMSVATVMSVTLVAAVHTTVAATSPRPPHVFFVVVDDLGSANVGFTRFGAPPYDPSTSPTVQTPHMDRLASEGVLLQRHYVHYVCTPTRSSVQTGRLPVHVQLGLANPASPAAGIPQNMTGLPDALRKGGAPYVAHLVGKWDAGMSTLDHTPQGRGYNSSLHYFEHMNDYWTQRAVQTSCYNATDLWDTDRPAKALRGTQYEEFIFRDRLLSIVQAHEMTKPLLLFYTPHVAHMPLEVPTQYFDRFRALTKGGAGDEDQCGQFKFPCSPPNPLVLDPRTGCTGGNSSSQPCRFACRAQYAASVALLDDVIGNVTAALVGRGMWDNTLMIFFSDNGGPVNLNSNAANNYPQRGGKFGPLEGGVRVAAFVSGGYLPREARGTHCDGLISVADWYGTLARLAGDANPLDSKAASADPPIPPIDSLDVWPLVVGINKTSPRVVLPIDKETIVVDKHKFILTDPNEPDVKSAGWTSPTYPNITSLLPQYNPDMVRLNCSAGCLFDLVLDPEERHNLVDAEPALADELRAQLIEQKRGFFQNHDSAPPCVEPNWRPGWWGNSCACFVAAHVHGDNASGPWLGPYGRY